MYALFMANNKERIVTRGYYAWIIVIQRINLKGLLELSYKIDRGLFPPLVGSSFLK